MLTGSLRGGWPGPSSASTSAASRSASLMMTVVYSCSAGSLSWRSSSCAAPRSPPSGFLISCASCRTIARLPPSWVSSAFSRRMRWCCVTSGELDDHAAGPAGLVERRDGHVERCAARRRDPPRTAVRGVSTARRRRARDRSRPSSSALALSRSRMPRPAAWLRLMPSRSSAGSFRCRTAPSASSQTTQVRLAVEQLAEFDGGRTKGIARIGGHVTPPAGGVAAAGARRSAAPGRRPRRAA